MRRYALIAMLAVVVISAASAFTVGTLAQEGGGTSSAGLIGHWTFDDGTATDVTGNGNDGNVNGATPVSGKIGPIALKFDGIDDHVDVGPLNNYPTSSISVGAWINASDLSNANCGHSDCRIVSIANGTSEQAHFLMLSTVQEGDSIKLRFRVKAGGSTATVVASSPDLHNHEWTHVAGTYDGSTMRVYVNGLEVGNTSKTGVLVQAPTVPLWIGGNPSGATSRPWHGTIDDVRIYSTALSESEIHELATYMAPTPTPDSPQPPDLEQVTYDSPSTVDLSSLFAWSPVLANPLHPIDEPANAIKVFLDEGGGVKGRQIAGPGGTGEAVVLKTDNFGKALKVESHINRGSAATDVIIQYMSFPENAAVRIEQDPTAQHIAAGQTAEFTITVTNTGDVELTDVEVRDPMADDCEIVIDSLGAGQSETFNCAVGDVQAEFLNASTVYGTTPAGHIVSYSDWAYVILVSPVEHQLIEFALQNFEDINQSDIDTLAGDAISEYGSDICISKDGVILIQMGASECASAVGNLAVAILNSEAIASDGVSNIALAVNDSLAWAQHENGLNVIAINNSLADSAGACDPFGGCSVSGVGVPGGVYIATDDSQSAAINNNGLTAIAHNTSIVDIRGGNGHAAVAINFSRAPISTDSMGAHRIVAIDNSHAVVETGSQNTAIAIDNSYAESGYQGGSNSTAIGVHSSVAAIENGSDDLATAYNDSCSYIAGVDGVVLEANSGEQFGPPEWCSAIP